MLFYYQGKGTVKQQYNSVQAYGINAKVAYVWIMYSKLAVLVPASAVCSAHARCMWLITDGMVVSVSSFQTAGGGTAWGTDREEDTGRD